MIDLDQPAQCRTRRRLATRRALALVVVGALLTGTVLGGVAMYFWRYYPLAASAERAESAVTVLLFAEPSTRTVNDDQRRIRVEAQVTAVNAGPVPVDVRAVRVDQPGVTVRSLEKERPIVPGTTFLVDVVIEWNCEAAEPTTLLASLSVETDAGQAREISPVALDGMPWIQDRRAACAGPG